MLFLTPFLMLAAFGASDAPEAYLFAHMTHEDYGRLYYSVSRDGLIWESLNNGKRITDDYRGHPDICLGHDGRFYLLGNKEREPEITLWVSDDLISWIRHIDFTPDLGKTPDFTPGIDYKGAPKMYYDEPSGTYVVTWHTPSRAPVKEEPERMWASMRTLYVTSTDLATFSDPKRLFEFDIATIDVIIRRLDGVYYAFIKDELFPTLDWPTGKTIRVSVGQGLLGPYAEPLPPITSNFREAPTVIPRPDGQGWYLYVEEYPAISYECFTARRPENHWLEVRGKNKKQVPPKARHGCMIPVTLRQYEAIRAAYPNDPKPE